MRAEASLTRLHRLARALATTALVVAAMAVLPPVAAVAAPVHGSIFKNPGALALDPHGHLWVADSDRFGVTEIDAATGREIRIVREPGYTLNDPIAMTVTRNELWILNGGVTYDDGVCTGGLVVVLSDLTGRLVRTVNLRHRGLRCASAIASDASEVWVSGASGERLAELSAATGRVEHLIYRGRDVGETGDLAIADGRLWYTFRDGVAERWAGSGAWIGVTIPTTIANIPNVGRSTMQIGPTAVAPTPTWIVAASEGGPVARLGGSIALIGTTTARVARIEQPAAAGYEFARAIVSDDAHVWIANGLVGTRGGAKGNSIDELSATTGRLVRHFSVADGPYSEPWGLATNGLDLFVADPGGGNVLEYATATGRLVRVIGPPAPTG